jgi:hypothetical protein
MIMKKLLTILLLLAGLAVKAQDEANKLLETYYSSAAYSNANLVEELKAMQTKAAEQQMWNGIIGVLVAIAVWFIARPVMLWYYKVNIQIANQEEQKAILKDIRELLDRQILEGESRSVKSTIERLEHQLPLNERLKSERV